MATPRQTCKAWFVLTLAYCSISLIEASHILYEEPQGTAPLAVDDTVLTRFHFRPPRYWINDPNGPFYYKGLYHLFYQYNPYGSLWGNIIWAHSVSTDLIHWAALDPAIYPSMPFDIFGCWSGSTTILPGNKPVILYTGIDTQKRQVQNIAFPSNLSDPYLREWVKPHYNPVITADASVNSSFFRDPTTAWFHPNRHWTLVIGSKKEDGNRGMALLYRSKDFMHWVKGKHPLHSTKGSGNWECPDFFPVSLKGKEGLDTSARGKGIKHVLKISLDLTRFDYYTLGKYYHQLDKYIPDDSMVDNSTGLRFDYGNFYASKTFYDPAKQRRILLGWANESDTSRDDVNKGWAGIHVIPRTIWLDDNGRQLLQWPVEEFETLRYNQVTLDDENIQSGDIFEVHGLKTDQADVEVIFDISSLEKAEDFDSFYIGDAQAYCGKNTADVKGGGVGPFGLYVLATSDLEERTAIFFKIFKYKSKHVVLMCNDPTRSTKRTNIYKPTFAGFMDVDIESTKQISLRTLIDHSVVESFGAGGKTCITSRVYPSLAIGDAAKLFIFNNGAEDVRVSKLSAWEIKSPEMNTEIVK